MMRKIISNDLDLCVGCNRCIRSCPVEEANIAYTADDGSIKVRVDSDKCIACGACIQACPHGSRDYLDDTERFISDLRSGMPISIFSAPAIRTNFPSYGRILTWLRQLGARQIYDVSLGADICTWAYIRYIQRNNPVAPISQPCPAIVNYALMHRTELLRYLIPVQSPMLCTAIYMRTYMGITDRIAALSPCIAKGDEFEQTGGIVSYNVTFRRLEEYIERRNIVLPQQESGFDHPDSALGSVFPMPGGLKENVELYLGKDLRVDKSEGSGVVYRALDEFIEEKRANLPALFDVLSCAEGCNLGSGCVHRRSTFEVNTAMEGARRKALSGRKKTHFEKMLATYDRKLRLEDFLRRYTAVRVHPIPIDDRDIERAYLALGKTSVEERNFNCGACGSDTCHEMARKVAKKVNCVANCVQKMRVDISREHSLVLQLQEKNLTDVQQIMTDITRIKTLSDDIIQRIGGVHQAVENYGAMAGDIERIAMHIHIISMNASVEAARAGNSGLSFSVIAEEIRKLASSSRESVQGTEVASQEAVHGIAEINNMVSAIGSAVAQAHENISVISEAINSMLQKTGDRGSSSDNV